MARKNVTYQNPIHQEENTPLVTIFETKMDEKKSVAKDSRGATYIIDLTKSSFGGIRYPVPGTQWYLKKISSVWTLMARAPQQNPELDPDIDPVVGDTFIGGEGTTYIVGDLQVTGSLTAGGGVDPDIGTIKLHPTNTPPIGWLICDGSAVSRATYAPLFVVIGTTFGVGDGSTTFNLPNIKGRVVVGRDSVQTEFDVIGETGGSKSTTLTTTELPAHTHAVGTLANAAETAHTHGISLSTGGQSADHAHQIGIDLDGGGGGSVYSVHVGGGPGGLSDFSTGASSDHSHGVSGTSAAGSSHNHSISGSTASSGSGTAFTNMPPYMVLNFIIKALTTFTPPPIGDGLTEIAFHAVGVSPSDEGHTGRITGDSFKRIIIRDNGTMEWGSGAALTDTNLYRSAVDVLSTDDRMYAALGFRSVQGNATDDAFLSSVTGDSVDRFVADVDGKLNWGSGSATRDTNLYRSAADSLKTDDFFVAQGGLSVKGVEIDSASSASGTLFRHNGTKYVAVAEESVAQYPNVAFVRQYPFSSNFQTSSTSYGDMDSMSVSFTKNKAGTGVLLRGMGSFYVTAGGSGGAFFGVNINSSDYDLCKISGNTASSSHMGWSGEYLLTGLSAGAYTVKLRWAAQSGASEVRVDTGDFASLTVMEVK